METDKLKNGVVGALLGASMMFGLTGGGDVDPKTGVPYEEIVTNPERDVYYNFDLHDIDSAYLATSHERLSTLRKSNDGTHAILKFDVSEIPRAEEFPTPMSHDEVVDFLSNCANDYCISE